MKKTIVAASIAAVLASTGVAGLASAAQNTNIGRGSELVSAVAKKFNLKESDVQAVFDENRTTMQAQRETELKDQVAQLVKDGKLTQAQADLINAKRAELQKKRDANRSSMENKSETDRKSTMDAERTALDKWFSDNNISTEYRYLVFGGRHGHDGPGGPGDPRDGAGQNQTSTSSSSATNQ